MTVACAVINETHVVIGVDSHWWNGQVYVQGPSKLQRHGPWAAAGSGAGWSGEMLEDCLPAVVVPGSIKEAIKLGIPCRPTYSVRAFRDACLAWSIEHRHGSTEDGGWSAPWNVIVAGPAGLWEVSGDGTIIQPPTGYLAIGSGGAVAYGALHATQDQPAEDRVRRALEAAVAHAEGCGAPVHIISIKLQETA